MKTLVLAGSQDICPPAQVHTTRVHSLFCRVSFSAAGAEREDSPLPVPRQRVLLALQGKFKSLMFFLILLVLDTFTMKYLFFRHGGHRHTD